MIAMISDITLLFPQPAPSLSGSLEVDVWAVGCMMGELLEGLKLFDAQTRELYRAIYISILACPGLISFCLPPFLLLIPCFCNSHLCLHHFHVLFFLMPCVVNSADYLPSLSDDCSMGSAAWSAPL